ncbi:unnamed protein product, partial [Prorocentrum cordatum]
MREASQSGWLNVRSRARCLDDMLAQASSAQKQVLYGHWARDAFVLNLGLATSADTASMNAKGVKRRLPSGSGHLMNGLRSFISRGGSIDGSCPHCLGNGRCCLDCAGADSIERYSRRPCFHRLSRQRDGFCRPTSENALAEFLGLAPAETANRRAAPGERAVLGFGQLARAGDALLMTRTTGDVEKWFNVFQLAAGAMGLETHWGRRRVLERRLLGGALSPLGLGLRLASDLAADTKARNKIGMLLLCAMQPRTGFTMHATPQMVRLRSPTSIVSPTGSAAAASACRDARAASAILGAGGGLEAASGCDASDDVFYISTDKEGKLVQAHDMQGQSHRAHEWRGAKGYSGFGGPIEEVRRVQRSWADEQPAQVLKWSFPTRRRDCLRIGFRAIDKMESLVSSRFRAAFEELACGCPPLVVRSISYLYLNYLQPHHKRIQAQGRHLLMLKVYESKHEVHCWHVPLREVRELHRLAAEALIGGVSLNDVQLVETYAVENTFVLHAETFLSGSRGQDLDAAQRSNPYGRCTWVGGMALHLITEEMENAARDRSQAFAMVPDE